MEKTQQLCHIFFCVAVECERIPIGVYCLEGHAFLRTASPVFATAMCLDSKNIGYSGLGISSRSMFNPFLARKSCRFSMTRG